jgi:hypothetical protein
MPDVLESWVVKMGHHSVVWGSVRVARMRKRRGSAHVVVVLIFVVQVLLAHEVFGTFVLVGAAILGTLLARGIVKNRAQGGIRIGSVR